MLRLLWIYVSELNYASKSCKSIGDEFSTAMKGLIISILFVS